MSRSALNSARVMTGPYAGTIVVGEGVTFFNEHGSHMTKGQAFALYERAKNDAMRFGRDLIAKLRK